MTNIFLEGADSQLSESVGTVDDIGFYFISAVTIMGIPVINMSLITKHPVSP